eukprot:5989773-Pyramimonas_sp.AAC.2
MNPWYKQTMYYHMRENYRILEAIPSLPSFGSPRLQAKAEALLRSLEKYDAADILLGRAMKYHPEVTRPQALLFRLIFPPIE